MRETLHICLASHDEVMFRSEEDLIYGFNCFANALISTESRGLADAEMTTHVHFEIQTDSYSEFSRKYRFPYGRYFNSKYERNGRLGERTCFVTTLKDISRITTCASYINRQGLHHGLSATPYDYPFCSANSFFKKELGKLTEVRFTPDNQRYKYLPRSADIPASFRIDMNGQLLRDDVLDTRYVEELYVTARNFSYQMNRISDETWKHEQLSLCKNEAPVTLDTIEQGLDDINVAQMLINERGRIRKDTINDLELCDIIDNHYVPMVLGDRDGLSVYSLPLSKRKDLGNRLYGEIKHGTMFCPPDKNPRSVSLKQLSRCLGFCSE